MAVSENQNPDFGAFPTDSWAIKRLPIKGGEHLYKYTLCYAFQGGLVAEARGKFAGMVVNEYDATNQPDGGLWATVLLFGTVKLPGVGFEQNDFFQPAFGLDNFTTSPQGNIRIGRIEVPLGPTEAWIFFQSDLFGS